MERCCCGLFDVEAGAKRLTFLSTVGFAVAAVVYTILATEYDSASIRTKEALLGYFHGSSSAAIANATVTSIGAAVSVLSCWGIYKKQRHWTLPFLIFWVLFMLLQLVYVALISIIYGQEMTMEEYENPSEKQEITLDFAIRVAWRTAFVLVEVYYFFVVYSYYVKQKHVDSFSGGNATNAEKGSLQPRYGFGTPQDTSF